jgi:hypothetical protein
MDLETYAKQMLLILQSKTGYHGTTVPDWKNVYNVMAFRPKFLVRPIENVIGNTHLYQSRFFDVVILEESEEGRQDMVKAFLLAQSDVPNGYEPHVDTIYNYAFLKRRIEVQPLQYDDDGGNYYARKYDYLPLGRHHDSVGSAFDNYYYTLGRFYLQYPITTTTSDISAASLFVTPSANYGSGFNFTLEATEYALSSERIPNGDSLPGIDDETTQYNYAITSFVKGTQQEINVLTAINAYQEIIDFDFDKYVLPFKFTSSVVLDNQDADGYSSLPQIFRKPHKYFKDRNIEPFFKLTTKVPDGFPYWIEATLQEEMFPNNEMVTKIQFEARWVL